MVSDIEDLGYSSVKVLLKTDQEPDIVDLQRKVVAARSGETVPTHSPVGGSQSTRPAATICEKVLHTPLKTEHPKRGKDEPRLKEGL